MESGGEALIRSALHDVANVLSGVQGILDLSDPARPLSSRDRDRLGAVLAEGLSLVQRTRHLALGTRPEGPVESPEAWASALQQQLRPLGTLFAAPLEVRCDAPPAQPVPGPALREFVHGMARLLLPFAGEAGLRVRCSLASEGWRLDFEPAESVPDCLLPAASGRRDIAARWTGALVEALGITLSHAGETLTAILPAPPR